jgi:hypothetical protein
MSFIRLKQPYKIAQHKLKRYSLHYNIPADNCLVIPVKDYGDDVACDVRWEDDNGELQMKERLFFKAENIEPIDGIRNYLLHELWAHYYDRKDVI